MTVRQRYEKNKHFIAAILVAAILYFLPSCNIIHNLQDQHIMKKLGKYHENHPELLDSALHKYFPPTTTIGTVDTNKKDLDSIAYYKKQADSLSHLKPTITHIHDTTNKCEDSTELFIDDSDNYYNGYNNGVEEGKALGRASCPVSTTTHDSTMTSQQAVAFKALTEQNLTLTSANISLTTSNKDKKNLLWIFGGIGFLLLIGLGYSIAKIFQKQTTSILPKL